MRPSIVAIACCAVAFTLVGCGGGEKDVWGGYVPPVVATTSAVDQCVQGASSTLPDPGQWAIDCASDGAATGVSYAQQFDPTNYSSTPVTISLTAASVTPEQDGLFIALQPDIGTYTTEEIGTNANTNTPIIQNTKAAGLADVRFMVDSTNGTRYLLVVNPLSNTYACGGPGFSDAELAALAESVLSTGLPRCGGTLTVDLANRTYQSTGLVIPQVSGDTNGTDGKLRIRINAGWPIGFDPVTGEEITP